MGIAYRLRQLWANLTAGPLTAQAVAEVAAALTPGEQDLFALFSPADQWHSVRVLHTLREAGYNDPDLAVAALLHDIGKTRYPLSAWDRTLIVIGQTLLPRRVTAWGEGPVAGWRRPFVVRAQHPAWGAEMAAANGSRPRVVELIARHAGPPGDDAVLRALQWADDRN